MSLDTPITCKPILLVDDHHYDIELTLAALAEHHLANQVTFVHDGVEALDFLYRRGAFAARPAEDPVVVLLDLKMPRVNGLEVLATEKAAPRRRHLPIVVLTSSREEPDLQRCYQLGVNAYVVKPVAFPDFMAAVKSLGVFWVAINEPAPAPAG